MTNIQVLQVLSSKARLRFYLGYSIIVGLIGALSASFAAINIDTPVALVFASTFINFVGMFFGLTAANNVTTTTEEVVTELDSDLIDTSSAEEVA